MAGRLMGPYEQELRRIESIGEWRIDRVESLSTNLQELVGTLGRLMSDLGWSGSSATAAGNTIDDIRRHSMHIIKTTDALHKNVNAANAIREATVARSQNLPSTFIPQWVHDAAKTGGEQFEFMGWYFDGVAGSIGLIENMVGNNREREAAAALETYREQLPDKDAIDLGRLVLEPPIPGHSPSENIPEPPAPGGGRIPPGGGGGGGGDYGRPTYVGGGPVRPPAPDDVTPPQPPPVRPPVLPPDPEPPTGGPFPRPPDYPYPVPDDPGPGVIPGPVTGGPGGVGGPGGGGGIGVGVGAGVGAGAVAAGVGLKAAGIGGGAMGFAGAGAGAGGAARPVAGGGLLGGGGAQAAGGGRPGAAGAGAAGGRGSGMLGNQGAAGGGRVAGGGAGGRDDETKRQQGRGLGGPIAPSLEDDGDYVPRAEGTRAGGRDELNDGDVDSAD
jgi:hypothetical protein